MRVLAAAYELGIPVTPRGTGTGNYGQAMPLSGGIVLDLSGFNRVSAIGAGRVVGRARRHHRRDRPRDTAPFRPGDAAPPLDLQHRLDRRLHRRRLGRRRLDPLGRPARLRQHHPPQGRHHGGRRRACSISPATTCTRSATPMARTASSPRSRCRSRPAYDWVDVIVGFDSLRGGGRVRQRARRAGRRSSSSSSPSSRAPAPHDYFLRHRASCRATSTSSCDASRRTRSTPFLAFTAPLQGRARSSSAATCSRPRTLRACRRSSSSPGTTRRCGRSGSIRRSPISRCSIPSRTRSISSSASTRASATRCRRISNSCASTARSPASACRSCASPRRSGSTRSCAIHEEMGAPIFNPHRYTLEEGGMKQTDEVQLAFKREADPQGLLNPGKMIAWEDPAYDYRSGKTYLFRGLAASGMSDARPRPLRPSQSRELCRRPAPDRRRHPPRPPATRSTIAISTPRASIRS